MTGRPNRESINRTHIITNQVFDKNKFTEVRMSELHHTTLQKQ